MGAHLAGDDTQQVVLDAQHIDGRQFAILDDEVQSALKSLVLLAFPVETHADGHALERERSILAIDRLKQQFAITVALPFHLSIDTAGNLAAIAHGTIHTVVAIEHKLNHRLIHDAYPHLRYLFLFHIILVSGFYLFIVISVAGFPNAG